MLLKIRDIGMISQADIELQGLTVIAGENDVGKSTVGKVFYSIIRAFNKYSEEFEDDRADFLEDQMERIYVGLRREIDFEENLGLKREFAPPMFSAIIWDLMHRDIPKELDDYFEYKRSLLESTDLSDDIKNDLIAKIDDIQNALSLEEDDIEVIKITINKMLKSEFNSQINNLASNKIGFIKSTEGENELFDITVKDNEIKELIYFDDLYFKDVTYIESPLLLQIHDMLTSSPWGRFSNRNVSVPIHIVDLIDKMQLSNNMDQLKLQSPFEDKENIINLYHKISDIIQGNISFKKNVKDFVFSKSVDFNKSWEISSGNIATGIKSLGILQMLIGSGILNDRSLLIIDEPEVHLHPKWQIEYAKVMIEMTKLQIPILINTHSPYILQGLKYYSEKEKCTNMVKYYLAELNDDHSSTIEDITGDLHKAFKKLSEPLQRLVWYEDDAE